MQHWLVKLSALAGTVLMIAGCTNPALQSERPGTVRPGSVSLFPNPSGLGSLSMRVIDERKSYGVQAVADVEVFDRVRISLSSSRVLIAPRTTELPGHVEQWEYHSPILTNLPPSNDYRLMVALIDNGKVVGQGAVHQIAVEPGVNRPVTVYINAMGEISFSSDEFHIPKDDWYPQVLAGSAVTMTAFFPWNGNVDDESVVTYFKYDLFDDQQNLAIASNSQQVAYPVNVDSEFPEGPRSGRATLVLPDLLGSESMEVWGTMRIYGLDKLKNRVVAKDSDVTIVRGADISVDLGQGDYWYEPN